MFGIECQRSEENVNFYFDDPEAARYVWKLAVLQVAKILNVEAKHTLLITFPLYYSTLSTSKHC